MGNVCFWICLKSLALDLRTYWDDQKIKGLRKRGRGKMYKARQRRPRMGGKGRVERGRGEERERWAGEGGGTCFTEHNTFATKNISGGEGRRKLWDVVSVAI